jgi:hypothetical protein
VSVLVGDDTIGNPEESRKTCRHPSPMGAQVRIHLVAAIPEANLMGSTASDSMSHCVHHASHAVDE